MYVVIPWTVAGAKIVICFVAGKDPDTAAEKTSQIMLTIKVNGKSYVKI
jgi:hypothetical protein